MESQTLDIVDCSWQNLQDVYENSTLRRDIELLESSLSVRDDSALFKSLVNTSTSIFEPYYRWAKYREGYSGTLVKEILKRYPSNSDETVLDPMCGSGSTLIACNELGLSSLGLDVNPYAVLASKIKCTQFSKKQLGEIDDCLNLMLKRAKTIKYKTSKCDNDVAKYFNKKNFKQLLSIKYTLNHSIKRGHKYYDFFKFALLAILEDCSDRKKDGNGLATRPTSIVDCYLQFGNQVRMMLKDLSHFRFPGGDKSGSLLCSAMDVNGELINGQSIGKIGSIIFSPPYANSFDYFESYKMELIFGEWSNSDNLNEHRKELIRNYRIGYGAELKSEFEIVELLCKELWSRIPLKENETGKRDGRTRLVPNMLRGYFEDMNSVIVSCMEVLRPNGYMHIVVDQSSYIGVPIPTDLVFAQLCAVNGFEVVEITKCRKANTSGQQLARFPYLKELLRESIVTVRKRPRKNIEV